MSDPLGITSIRRNRIKQTQVEYVIARHPLHRVLAFTRRTIDDVINDPIARNEVRAYYKLHKWIHRSGEISDLERQWNSIPV